MAPTTIEQSFPRLAAVGSVAAGAIHVLCRDAFAARLATGADERATVEDLGPAQYAPGLRYYRVTLAPVK